MPMTRLPPRARATVAAALAVALLGACASKVGTVVLLPEKDGGDTAVVVRQGDEQARPAVRRRQPDDGGATRRQVERGRGAEPVRARAGRATCAADEVHALLRRRHRRLHRGVEARPGGSVLRDRATPGAGRPGRRPHGQRRRRPCQRRAGTEARRDRKGGADPPRHSARERGCRWTRKRELAADADGVAEPRNRRVEILVRWIREAGRRPAPPGAARIRVQAPDRPECARSPAAVPA
jgi:hypothetical protein